jgi:hypothetical protein
MREPYNRTKPTLTQRLPGLVAFPLMALAFVLMLKGLEGEGQNWAYLAPAILCGIAGLAAVRLRHTRR